MPDRILIDANSLGHAAHQGQVLKAGDQETQAVYGFLRSIRGVRANYPGASILILWDGLSWRKAQSAVYKANRVDSEEKRENKRRYATQTPFIRRALKHLAVPQLAAANMEADDLAARLVRSSVTKGDFVRLITGDQDWLQLVQENVIWEDHRDASKRVNVRSFKEKTGYPDAVQFVQAKALQGDVSDNLPGVGKIGEKGAADLLGVWGRVEAFLADPNPAEIYKLKTGKKLTKAFADFHANVDGRQEKFFHNHAMMNLNGELPAPERMVLAKGEFDAEAFKSICHELGFASIYRPDRFDDFIEPFKKAA